MSMFEPELEFNQEDYNETVQIINNMKVVDLKGLCRSIGFKISGKKQDLIDRLVGYFENGRAYDDWARLYSVRTLVKKKQIGETLPMYFDLYNAISSGTYKINEYRNHYTREESDNLTRTKEEENSILKETIKFEESPFYKIKQLINGTPQKCVPINGKGNCELNIVFNNEENGVVYLENESIKVYLFSGVCSNNKETSENTKLEYPNTMELYINGQQLLSNFKGIKGKIGTAKPVDITLYMFPSPHLNKIRLQYVQSALSFIIFVYIIELISCQTIIDEMMKRKHISKSETIGKMKLNVEDDDIFIFNTSISLNDPLSRTKIKYPTKSFQCDHTQCFDGLVYLESQMQIPSWNCPLCNKKIRFEDLAISDYFLEILNTVSSKTESVNVNEDGSWNAIQSDSAEKMSELCDDVFSMEKKKKKIPFVEVITIDSDSDVEKEKLTDSNNSEKKLKKNNYSIDYPNSIDKRSSTPLIQKLFVGGDTFSIKKCNDIRLSSDVASNQKISNPGLNLTSEQNDPKENNFLNDNHLNNSYFTNTINKLPQDSSESVVKYNNPQPNVFKIYKPKPIDIFIRYNRNNQNSSRLKSKISSSLNKSIENQINNSTTA